VDPSLLYGGLIFLLSFLLALYLTPIVRRGALRFGIMDVPDQRLKRHREPIPYLGGIAVYFSYLLALSASFPFDGEVLALLLSGTVVLLIGLLDDLGSLPPAVKLLGQLFAVFVLLRAGVYIKLTFLPQGVAIALTALWLILLTNAFNIIDVMDGLAPGTGAIASLGFAVVAFLNGRVEMMLMALALGGALSGFLRYNFTPARIFLGDAGSLFLGFMVGGFAVLGSYTGKNPLGFFAPVIILGVPLFDTLSVIWARLRKGLSPFRGSPDHFALKLQRLGLSVPKVVLLSYGVSVFLTCLGILLMETTSSGFAIGLCGGLLILGLVGTEALRRVGK